jgi:integrase
MPAISIATFASELMTLYAPPRRARSTQRQVAQVLREFATAGVNTTADLRAVMIARWMDLHPARSAVTHKSHLRCLRAVISYALAEGYLERSPFQFRPVGSWIRDDTAPSRARTPRHRSIDDVARILSTASDEASGGRWEARRLEALLYTYAYLGLRAAEALHLWTSDVSLEGRSVSVQAHVEDGWRPKTLKSAAVLPIAEPLADVLGRWLPHTGARWVFPGKKLRGPWVTGGPGVRPLDQVKELGRRAGVPGLTIASFRKTIGTYAKSWGFSQLELKALLRHSHVETQKWYDEEAVESLRPAAAKVQFPRIA